MFSTQRITHSLKSLSHRAINMINDSPSILFILNPMVLRSAVRLSQRNSSLGEVETELQYVLMGLVGAILLELVECMKPYMTRIAIAEQNRVTSLRAEAAINRWSFSVNSGGTALSEAQQRRAEPSVADSARSAPTRPRRHSHSL